MAKKFKVSISDTVPVPVKGTIKNDDGTDRAFSFTLQCKRLPAAEMRKDVKDGERPAGEIVTKVATGWKDQDLVLDPDNGDAPAEFSAEAMEAMLDIPGMAMVCFQSYLNEAGAKQKN